jgi:predicted kinase
MLVVPTGLPGSGKTTLAMQLSNALESPLISKDRYKEILFPTVLPRTSPSRWTKSDESRQ